MYKRQGIGRLLWLKCFACVEIESFYKSVDGNIKNRHFAFTPDGITDLPVSYTHLVRELPKKKVAPGLIEK